MNWKNWLTGLFWAIITGIGTGLTFVIVDPDHFNIYTGWKNLLGVCIAFALWSMGSYLKDSRPKDGTMSVKDPARLVMLLFVLLGGTMLVVACAPTPPPNLYTAPVQRQYDATPLQKSILALSQTAVAMNAATGPTHLKDADTRLVRDFALQTSTAIDDWVAGHGTLNVIQGYLSKLLGQLSVDAKNGSLKDALASVKTLVDAIPLQ